MRLRHVLNVASDQHAATVYRRHASRAIEHLAVLRGMERSWGNQTGRAALAALADQIAALADDVDRELRP